MERQLFEVERGPRMLPRKQRFQVWWGMSLIVFWFGSCFFIISYRLRADDLELMEREVYEELKMKKDVERFINQGKMQGLRRDPTDFIKK